MKAVYFAWVRERVGCAEEELSPPPEVATVGELIAWLKTRDEGYAYAFENAAVDSRRARQDPRRHDASIAGAREIAFFPPMTGG